MTGASLAALTTFLLAACQRGQVHPLVQSLDSGSSTGETGPAHPDSAPTVDTGEPALTERVPDGLYECQLGTEVLPVLLIDTDGISIPNNEKIPGRVEVITQHDGSLEDLDGAPRDFTADIGIEERGRSSVGWPKDSFNMEIQDENGEDLDASLLCMPDESDWVLYAPYSDKTFMRNMLAYELGRRLGSWNPRTVYAEVFVNDEYQGVYLVIEKIRIDPDRVDIPPVASSAAEGDITGGYIAMREAGESSDWVTSLGTGLGYYYPSESAITQEQADYLADLTDGMEAAMMSADMADPLLGYAAWIHVDSWIDYFIVQELARNVDAYRRSTFFYKEPDSADGLVHMGPLWDFNLSFGNADYCDGWLTDGFIYDDRESCGDYNEIPFWWEQLMTDPAFQDRLRCRWEDLRQGVLADDAILDILDQAQEQLAVAQVRDQETWGTIGTYVWPNYFIGDTWEEEIEYMRDWTVQRMAWMDSAMPGTCSRRERTPGS